MCELFILIITFSMTVLRNNRMAFPAYLLFDENEIKG